MANGLTHAPRIFTKLLKPVFAYLRSQRYDSVIYLDDTLLIGNSYQEALDNITQTAQLLYNLGFTIYPDKSSSLLKLFNSLDLFWILAP